MMFFAKLCSAFKVTFLISLSACFVVSGCASHQSEMTPEPSLEFAEYQADSAEAPLDVEVSQAFIRDQQLNVMVRLTPKTDMDSKVVAVSVSGLLDGEVREEQIQSLADATEMPRLLGGESYVLLFALQAQDLSEYQVKASWGKEAQELLASIQAVEFETEKFGQQEARANLKRDFRSEDVLTAQRTELAKEEEKPIALKQASSTKSLSTMAAQQTESRVAAIRESQNSTESGLTVDVVGIERSQIDCDESPCDDLLSINALLVNNTDSPITEIVLGMGLFWANSGDTPDLPSNGTEALDTEEVINIVGVSIEPGQEKKIRVRVDRPVPIVPGGEFIPHLRLLSFVAQAQVKQ
jgi:hypothetical protein